MNNNFNIKMLDNAKKVIVGYAKTDSVIDGKFAKKKTIEKWEQGKNPVKGPTAKLVFLINEEKSLLTFLDFLN